MAAPIDLEAETAALYRLPLAEFIVSRDALAARCRSAGEREASGRTKKLAKPSASAWAVNQLHWRDAAALQRFFAAARRVREAQLTGEPAPAVRAAAQERRDALGALIKRAEDLLQGAGHGTPPSILRRVRGTLEAVAHRCVIGEPVPLGCLEEDLDPPGLDVLAGLGASPPALPSAEARPASGDPDADGALSPRADAGRPPRADAAPPTSENAPDAVPSAAAAALSGGGPTRAAGTHAAVAATRFRRAQLEAAAARARRRAEQAAQERATMDERLTAVQAELQEAQRRLARAQQRLGDAEAALRDAQARVLAAEAEKRDAERAAEAAGAAGDLAAG